MKLRTNSMVLCAVALAATQLACAEIGLRDPRTQERVVSTSTAQVPVQGLASGRSEADGTLLMVEASHVCDTVTRSEVETTAVRERYNADATTTWAMGLGGVAAAAAGTAILVDSRNVYPNDETSRTYNPTGQDKAVLWGSALTATGVALATVAIVDAFRAQGEETHVSSASRDGTPEKRGTCSNAPLVGATIMGVAMGSGAKYRLGFTGDDGRLEVDLASVLPDDFDWTTRRLEVLVETQAVGEVDLAATFALREAAAWDTLPIASCKNPKESTSCDPVREFLKKYPDGAHTAEAKALLEEMEPTLQDLYSRETWAGLSIAQCRDRAFETSTDGEVACIPVREFLNAYPDGAHSEEAGAILKEAEKRIARLRREEEEARKKADAAARAEEARRAAEARKQCIGTCKMGCSTWQVANEESCRTGCIARNCSGGGW